MKRTRIKRSISILVALAMLLTMGMLLTCCGQKAEPADDPSGDTEDTSADYEDDYEYIPEMENALEDIPEAREDYTDIPAAELEEMFADNHENLYPYWNKYVAVSAYITKLDEDGSIGEEMDISTEPFGDDPEYLIYGSFQLGTEKVIEQLKNYSGDGKVTVLGKLVTVSEDEGYTVYVTGIEE